MYSESHIELQQLQKKIDDLFDYRLFPELINTVNPGFDQGNDHFYSILKELQKRIYFLDAHLEANAYPDENILDKLWVQIYNYLAIFKVDKKDWSYYTRHIARYQKHELDLRKNKLPLRLDMEYFYYYKSCDVKLLRRLIYEKFNIPGSLITEGDWKNYDLITEVNDDIADLYEDLEFINGNSFLISLLVNGKENTERTFADYIDKIKTETQNRLSKGRLKSALDSRVNELTVLRCDETLSLLSLMTDKIKDSELRHSLLNKTFLKIGIHEKPGYRFSESST